MSVLVEMMDTQQETQMWIRMEMIVKMVKECSVSPCLPGLQVLLVWRSPSQDVRDDDDGCQAQSLSPGGPLHDGGLSGGGHSQWSVLDGQRRTGLPNSHWNYQNKSDLANSHWMDMVAQVARSPS